MNRNKLINVIRCSIDKMPIDSVFAKGFNHYSPGQVGYVRKDGSEPWVKIQIEARKSNDLYNLYFEASTIE